MDEVHICDNDTFKQACNAFSKIHTKLKIHESSVKIHKAQKGKLSKAITQYMKQEKLGSHAAMWTDDTGKTYASTLKLVSTNRRAKPAPEDVAELLCKLTGMAADDCRKHAQELFESMDVKEGCTLKMLPPAK